MSVTAVSDERLCNNINKVTKYVKIYYPGYLII